MRPATQAGWLRERLLALLWVSGSASGLVQEAARGRIVPRRCSTTSKPASTNRPGDGIIRRRDAENPCSDSATSRGQCDRWATLPAQYLWARSGHDRDRWGASSGPSVRRPWADGRAPRTVPRRLRKPGSSPEPRSAKADSLRLSSPASEAGQRRPPRNTPDKSHTSPAARPWSDSRNTRRGTSGSRPSSCPTPPRRPTGFRGVEQEIRIVRVSPGLRRQARKLSCATGPKTRTFVAATGTPRCSVVVKEPRMTVFDDLLP